MHFGAKLSISFQKVHKGAVVSAGECLNKIESRLTLTDTVHHLLGWKIMVFLMITTVLLKAKILENIGV